MAVPGHSDLRIQSLALSRFRNYESFSLDGLGDLTIFVGKNGVGKTNILEGIALMTSASSFRHAQISQLVRQNDESARITMDISDGNRQINSQLLLEPGKKRYLVNGKAKSVADVRGVLPSVAFTPDDLELAKKSSRVRRDALDDMGVQLSRNYSIVRRDYEKTVRYKNRLLKDDAAQALVESINDTLVMCGSQLFCYRLALFSRIVPVMQRNYSSIAMHAGAEKSETLSAVYKPSWDYLDGGDAPGLLGDGELRREHVRQILSDSLVRHGEYERIRKRSLVGPHNDKIDLFLDGRDVSDYASQGQQRSVVLAWKLAEVELVSQSLGVSPVLLLDDVMSELDADRRDMLVRFVTDDTQTFITATDLSGFNEELLKRARIVELGQPTDQAGDGELRVR